MNRESCEEPKVFDGSHNGSMLISTWGDGLVLHRHRSRTTRSRRNRPTRNWFCNSRHRGCGDCPGGDVVRIDRN